MAIRGALRFNVARRRQRGQSIAMVMTFEGRMKVSLTRCRMSLKLLEIIITEVGSVHGR